MILDTVWLVKCVKQELQHIQLVITIIILSKDLI